MLKISHAVIRSFQTQQQQHRRFGVSPLTDGLPTNLNPLPIIPHLRKDIIVVTTIYLANNPDVTFQRQLYHKAQIRWNDGEQGLFNMVR